MARDIRMAGFLIGMGSPGIGFGSQGLNINGSQCAIQPQNSTTGPDQITVASAAIQFMTSNSPVTVTNINGNMVTLSANVGTFFDTGQNSFMSLEGDVVNPLYQITAVGGQTLTLSPAPPDYLATILTNTGTGPMVFRVEAITYSVSNGVLYRNENNGAGPQPLAGDGINTFVEDLQFAYQVAGNAGWYNDPNSDFPAGTNATNITMVRINICVRTNVPDPSGAQFTEPPLEDHTTGLNGPDGFRRRVYTTVVTVRNTI
jgi:hypothetical protein